MEKEQPLRLSYPMLRVNYRVINKITNIKNMKLWYLLFADYPLYIRHRLRKNIANIV